MPISLNIWEQMATSTELHKRELEVVKCLWLICARALGEQQVGAAGPSCPSPPVPQAPVLPVTPRVAPRGHPWLETH